MKVEKIVNVFKDNGEKISIGDRIVIETDKELLVGTVKNIKENVIGVCLDVEVSVGITYRSIKSIK